MSRYTSLEFPFRPLGNRTQYSVGVRGSYRVVTVRRNQGEHRDEGGGLVKEDRVGWIDRQDIGGSLS